VARGYRFLEGMGPMLQMLRGVSLRPALVFGSSAVAFPTLLCCLLWQKRGTHLSTCASLSGVVFSPISDPDPGATDPRLTRQSIINRCLAPAAHDLKNSCFFGISVCVCLFVYYNANGATNVGNIYTKIVWTIAVCETKGAHLHLVTDPPTP